MAEERARAIREQAQEDRGDRSSGIPRTPNTGRSSMAAAGSVPEEPEEIENELIFSDMSALEVIQILEELTGKASIRQQSIPAVKINFDSRGPMPKSEAIVAIETLLSINGIAVTLYPWHMTFCCPATIPIHDYTNMLRQRLWVNFF